MSRYYIENGLRKVKPYYHPFLTFVKRRWIGRTLLEVLTVELGQLREVIEKAVNSNYIYVAQNCNKKQVEIYGWEQLENLTLNEHDKIYNLNHVHEPSIPYTGEIEIVHQDEEILVVNKPSGTPTHPTGSFRYNSVTEILQHDLNLPMVSLCHRLDKATSGVLILGLTKQGLSKYIKIIGNKDNSLSKHYVARVVGEFPSAEGMVTCPVFQVNAHGRYINETNADNLPTNSTTIFQRVKYNKKTNESIVICKPITGKMHQIRIHLRNLGHPIVNDVMYNPGTVDTPTQLPVQLKNHIEQELYSRLFKVYPSFEEYKPVAEVLDIGPVNLFEITNFYKDETIQNLLSELTNAKKLSLQEQKNGEICSECDKLLFPNDAVSMFLSIWLHAFKYKSTGVSPFNFETQLPSWCDI